MAVGDQYRRIGPADQFILDVAGNLVGVRSGQSRDAEFRGGTPTEMAELVRMASYGTRRILKSFSGSLQLTGGTAGTKTTLLQVALPDGWLSDPTVRLDIEWAANYTNSANTKNYGVDIGATAGAAVAILARAPTTTASETTRIIMQRSGATPARFWLTLPNNYRLFGNAAGSGATAGVLASASINPDATGQSLFFWAQIDPNTEQITYEHLTVALERAEA